MPGSMEPKKGAVVWERNAATVDEARRLLSWL